MAENTASYAIIGFCILIFLFQLIIIWYMWWIYNQMNDNYNDLNDMIIDIYKLQVIDAEANCRDAVLHIPKRSRDAYIKRHKDEKSGNTDCT